MDQTIIWLEDHDWLPKMPVRGDDQEKWQETIATIRAMDRAQLEGRAIYLTARAALWKQRHEEVKRDRDALLKRLKIALHVVE
jgi:hypothetical protein